VGIFWGALGSSGVAWAGFGRSSAQTPLGGGGPARPGRPESQNGPQNRHTNLSDGSFSLFSGHLETSIHLTVYRDSFSFDFDHILASFLVMVDTFLERTSVKKVNL